VLAATSPYTSARTLLPSPEILPPAERRRAGRVIKLALAIGAEAVAHAGHEAGGLASVFCSSGGDGDNCHEICATLAGSERLISPTRFHNSVHNAAAGYWSIAHGCTEASVTVCAYDASFAAGLIEALSQISHDGCAVLLFAYDADYPSPLQERRTISDAFGVSLLLGPPESPCALANLKIELCTRPPSRLDQPELEALRQNIPAARCLPMLQLLAQSRSGSVVLEYLDSTGLAVEVQI